MLVRKLEVGPQWKIETDEQSTGVYNIKAADGLGKEFFFIGYDNQELMDRMTAAINAYDAAKPTASTPTKDTPMHRITIVFGILIAAISVGFLFATNPHETAALHPAGIGLLLILCGALANTENPKKRMLWMHIAVTLGLISLLTTGIRAVSSLAKGTAMTTNPAGFEERVTIALISLIYVILCVRSFIAARRARTA
jgi:uncharacterized membrane protein HdeD (DUF308 family)